MFHTPKVSRLPAGKLEKDWLPFQSCKLWTGSGWKTVPVVGCVLGRLFPFQMGFSWLIRGG